MEKRNYTLDMAVFGSLNRGWKVNLVDCRQEGYYHDSTKN